VEGLAAIVATRDAQMRPALARGWGLTVSDSGDAMTLCVGLPPASTVLENLTANGAIAVNCSSPSTYRSVQVKGVVTRLADPTAEQLEVVEAHVVAFSTAVEANGLPPDSGHDFLEDELIAVTMTPRDLFDQTPGPNAGARL